MVKCDLWPLIVFPGLEIRAINATHTQFFKFVSDHEKNGFIANIISNE